MVLGYAIVTHPARITTTTSIRTMAIPQLGEIFSRGALSFFLQLLCGPSIIGQQETHWKTRREVTSVGFGRKDQIGGIFIPELSLLSIN